MPNNIENRITMKGITNEDLFTRDKEVKLFDFNKIIEMPESLKLTSGSIEKQSIDIALNKFQFNKEEEKRICEQEGKSLAEMIELGKQYLDNVVKYGHTTWYGWCRDNWGTKWNAYSNEQIDENTIQFQTAWCYPEPIIIALSKMYPSKEVRIQWSDEDTANNCGDAVYKNGEIIEGGFLENDSNEAYEMFIKLHGESDCLDKDDEGNWYHKDCDSCNCC